LVVGLLLVGLRRGMRIFVVVVPFPPLPLDPLLQLVGDSPSASVCAVLFFVTSGG
jgi:hypothetical protein